MGRNEITVYQVLSLFVAHNILEEMSIIWCYIFFTPTTKYKFVDIA